MTTEKTPAVAAEPVVAAPSSPKTLFHFPTVGNGITVAADSYEDALAIVQKL